MELPHGQFVLYPSDKTIVTPSGGWKRRFGSYILKTQIALPVAPIRDLYDNSLEGYVLGNPIISNRPSKLTIDRLGISDEDFLRDWHGRYVVILNPEQPKVYLDPIGSMGCVYSPTDRACASTPWLMPSTLYDEALHHSYGMPRSGLYYPAGMTPTTNTHRLLPNFRLDMETMTTERYWPCVPFQNSDPRKTVPQIMDKLSNTISAIVQRESYFSLTAGRDSRLLLAAARKYRKAIKFFTYAEEHMTIDYHMAGKIAGDMHLNWSGMLVEQPCDEDLNRWQADVGHSVAGPIWRHSASFKYLAPDHVRVTGVGGEIGRCYYWRHGDQHCWHRGDQADTHVDAKVLLDRMGLPTDKATLGAMNDWFLTLPKDMLSSFDILDLAYIEHRLGCWAGPSLYGSDRYFSGQIVPFADRDLIELMMSLPPEYRMAQRMVDDGIRLCWPELLDYPFNEYTGMRRYFTIEGVKGHLRSLKHAMAG